MLLPENQNSGGNNFTAKDNDFKRENFIFKRSTIFVTYLFLHIIWAFVTFEFFGYLQKVIFLTRCVYY